MGNRALFLDRDGVINIDYGYVYTIEKFEFIEGIFDLVKHAHDKGYLIILVPAHNKLYSKFDKAIGHFRRYEMEFFEKIKIDGSRIIKLSYLDSTGYFLYYLNKIFFKEEIYPSKLKIFIWYKLFTPVTYFLDKILFYKFGKNILYVIQKSSA